MVTARHLERHSLVERSVRSRFPRRLPFIALAVLKNHELLLASSMTAECLDEEATWKNVTVKLLKSFEKFRFAATADNGEPGYLTFYKLQSDRQLSQIIPKIDLQNERVQQKPNTRQLPCP